MPPEKLLPSGSGVVTHENWLEAARAVRDADLILLRRQEEFT